MPTNASVIGLVASALALTYVAWTSRRDGKEKKKEHQREFLMGVIGGLGPEASARFLQYGIVGGRVRLARSGIASSYAAWTSEEYSKVLEFMEKKDNKTRKSTTMVVDQDHIPIVLVSAPDIPPRPSFILGLSLIDPAPAMARAATRLKDAGCTHVGIVCATAHYFVDAVEKALGNDAEMIDMISVGLDVAKKMVESSRRKTLRNSPVHIGILATKGALSTPVFTDRASELDLTLVSPIPEEQELVEHVIFSPHGIKAGFDKLVSLNDEHALANLVNLIRRSINLAKQIDSLKKEKDESELFVVVLACTELPLLLSDESVESWAPKIAELNNADDLYWLKRIRFVDLAEALADHVIRLSLLSRVQ